MQPYLFIDGGYLREVVEGFSQTYFKGGPLFLDYSTLSARTAKCFYYDCQPPKRKQETPEQYERRCWAYTEMLASMRKVDGWHIFEGKLTGEGERARQKQVDIQIAVDMLSHAHLRTTDTIRFIAGDQDFKPLVDALVRQGMHVILIYEQRSASAALIDAADARRPLLVPHLHAWLDSRCQREHPLPQQSGSQTKDTVDAALLERGTGNALGIELWRLPDGRFKILHLGSANPQSFSHMDHADREFLKLFYENTNGPTTWTGVSSTLAG